MPFLKLSSGQPFVQTPIEKPKNGAIDLISLFSRLENLTPHQREKRVTIWHRTTQRKIAGSAAPLRKNLEKYLKKHLECDVFVGQDSWDKRPTEIDQQIENSIADDVARVDIWNRVSMRRITGRASPFRKNLLAYLARNPNSEVYTGQDKRGDVDLGIPQDTQFRSILPKMTSTIGGPTQTW